MANTTSFTLENLAILEKAIAGGVRRVKYSDKEIEYRSLNEMLQVYNLMHSVLHPKKKGKRGVFGGRRRVAVHSKGLNEGSGEPFNGCCDDDGDI